MRDARRQAELLEAGDVVRDDPQAHRELALWWNTLPRKRALSRHENEKSTSFFSAHLGDEVGTDRRSINAVASVLL